MSLSPRWATRRFRGRRLFVGRASPIPRMPSPPGPGYANRFTTGIDAGQETFEFRPDAACAYAGDVRWHGDAATAPYRYTEKQEARLTEWFRVFGETMEELDVADWFFLWIWDESSSRHHEAMKQKCRIVRAGSEKIRRMQPGGGLPASMVGHINQRVPLTAGHAPTFADAARSMAVPPLRHGDRGSTSSKCNWLRFTLTHARLYTFEARSDPRS